MLQSALVRGQAARGDSSVQQKRKFTRRGKRPFSGRRGLSKKDTLVQFCKRLWGSGLNIARGYVRSGGLAGAVPQTSAWTSAGFIHKSLSVKTDGQSRRRSAPKLPGKRGKVAPAIGQAQASNIDV